MTKSPSMDNLFGGGKLLGGDNGQISGWLNLPKAELGQNPNIDIGILGIGAATPYPVGSYCMDAPNAIRNARSWPNILGQHDFDLYGLKPSGGVLPEGVHAADYGNLDVMDSAAPEDTAQNRAKIKAAWHRYAMIISCRLFSAVMIACPSQYCRLMRRPISRYRSAN